MNKDWSEMNKALQQQLKRKDSFAGGIRTLLKLREVLFEQTLNLKTNITADAFSARPFPNANGYHNKTIAYSLWHIFRIEDIVANTIIREDEQVFYKNDFQQKMHSRISTTGNELEGKEIADFSKELDIDALYEYTSAVKDSTDKLLLGLNYEDLKKKIPGEARSRIIESCSLSNNEHAVWLIDYWCDKDVKGLIQMPFSRHWIMHIEAALRIAAKLQK